MRNKGFVDIELDKVLEEVRSLSLFPESASYITEDRFTTDEDALERRYRTIDSYMNLICGEYDLTPFPSISHIFPYAEETHRDIEGTDIYKVGEFLSSYRKMLAFLSRTDELHEEDDALCDEILSSIDRDGNVLEDHPRLKPLRKALERIKEERGRFSQSFIKANIDKLQNENPVYRNERVVIPIRAERKSDFECYVQGSSSSGQTLFVEPFHLVELNNDVVIAEERIRAEAMKILHELSEKVRGILRHLGRKRDEVIEFDFHYSFAVYSRRHRCAHPMHGEHISLVSARHPLLGAKAVPIDLEIKEGTRVLVISGANAGGKTVTMKTLALLAALNQISSFIPASELSTLPYFDRILTDIGDGQSIENEASTFSSHLRNIAFISRNATVRSLVLLDELGSGTDPEEGSALSVAILSYLSTRCRLVMVTSHYSKVKNYAYMTDCMMNSSMEFDLRSGNPTYRVISGIPGDSHAIEAATRMHLPKEIVDMAKADLKDAESTSGKVISSLIAKSRTLDRKMTELEQEKRSLRKKVEELEKEDERLRLKDLELEKAGHKELSSWMRETRKELENLVKDVRTGNLTSEKTRNVKAFIRKLEEKEKETGRDIEEKSGSFASFGPVAEFAVGESVLCGASGAKGKVAKKLDGGKYLVALDSGLRLTLPASMMKRTVEKTTSVQISHFSSKSRKAEYVLDIRGLTLEEARKRLDDQFESAILDGMESFSIIHGFGDGILQRGVHDYLRKRNDVEDYHFALPEDGGMGKTYVKLRQ